MANNNGEYLISGNSISVKNYFKDIRKIEVLSGEDQTELAVAAKKGDEKAKAKLVECNLKFVLSIAKEYQHLGLPVEELIQEGNIGLIKAIEKYDETRGFRFISYAVWWVRQSILQALYETGSTVRLPVNKINANTKITKAQEKLFQQLDREPTADELSQVLDFKEKEISEILAGSNFCVSIDSKVSDDSDTELSEIIPGDTLEDIDEKINSDSLKTEINNVFESLTEREVKILNMFFGLNGYHEMSLKEIGEELDLTNERVRQVKELALKKLRMFNQSSKLREFLNCKIS